jgi:hypothetical protein
MPFQKLQFRPGIVREVTSLTNEGGWYDGDKIRFRAGMPQKIGGWTAQTYTTFLGTCRSLWNWVTLRGFNIVGIGTNLKFYLENGSKFYDITPIRETNLNTTTFAATNGSSTITVTDTQANAIQVGDFVTFSGVNINGLGVGGNITQAVLEQEYQIQTVISGTQYTISARAAVSGNIATNNGGAPVVANASDSGNGGSTTDSAYQIGVGPATNTIGTGWGVSPWGGFVSGGSITALNGALSAAASSVTVSSTTGFGTPSGIILVGNPTIPSVETSLSLGVDNSVTTIPVSSTALFAATGSILIDTEIITYTGKTATTFTGCTRGSSGSSAATHNVGAVVYQNKLELITYTSITGSTVFDGTVGRGADGTTATTFATLTPVHDADEYPGWGQAFSGSSAPIQQLRIWSQSNYGEDLLFSPRGGPFYRWQPLSGSTPAWGTRGFLIQGTDVPSKINQIMVSDATRITIAFGCDSYGTYNSQPQDPMLIRWSDQEDYYDWTDTETNQAGSFRLSRGSSIVAALQSRLEILVWTDSAMYSMQYIGFPLVWSFNILSDNISIASQNAVATATGAVFWMGIDKFYVYDGRVNTLPCSVRTYVYDNINTGQLGQVFAGTNEAYTEIWWFYCSKNSTTIDSYVIYNYGEKVWYYGTLNRTAWLDTSLRAFPIATSSAGLLLNHEASVDDGSTNPPSPITSYIQSSDFDIGDGHSYGFVSQIIPDITFDGSNTSGLTSINPLVKFTVRPRQNPGSGYGPAPNPTVLSAQSYAGQQTHNVQQFGQILYTRVRGRQMAFRVESDTRGTQWQLGVPKIDIRSDGRR